MATEVGTADTDLLVFKGKNLQDYEVVELKRFLEERGLKKSGKKVELLYDSSLKTLVSLESERKFYVPSTPNRMVSER